MKKALKIIFYVASIAIILSFGYGFLQDYNNPENKLQREAEDQLKKQMNDPSSYEFVSFQKNIVHEVTNPETKYEYFILKFRGKNKVGGLILDEVSVKATRLIDGDTNSKYVFIGIE